MKIGRVFVVLTLSLTQYAAIAAGTDDVDQAVATELKTLGDAFPGLAISAEELVKYAAVRTDQRMQIDGKLDEPIWQTVNKTPRFVDLITGGPTRHETRAAIVWDDEALYVGYWVTEPKVAARFERRDAPLYYENNVELFVAGKDAYYELELNAKGTIYEAFFVWQDAYRSGDYRSDPQLAPSARGSRSFDGVGLRNHPRGRRLAFLRYDLPRLRSGVRIDGTLNDGSDVDQGWAVELALPWESMKWLAAGDGRSLPPEPGDQWRMNLFRFNKYKSPKPNKDSGGWAVGKHGVWDSHVPELFPIVTFTVQ